MSARKVNVTVVRSVEHTAEVAIDEAEYLGWLDGDEDTPEALREFLEAGSDVDDIIRDVVELGAVAVIDSGLVRASTVGGAS
ncbi:hypothetical protein [Rhodococcus sp. YH1]|uniref:hypothetical protein n=1 Tax=Rhodococcus sp. YH1 TaxID=89066 RepID=UPI001386978C|nr:hypothetical protein [Rhodococcus sp. YH1]